MAETSGDTALGRMARARTGASAPPVGAAAIWSRVLPRVAEEGLRLDLRADEIVEETVRLHSAVDDVAEGSLLISLVAPGLPESVAIVDAGLLTALIEVQTTGRVTSARVEPRRATATDHALVAHVLDRWLAEVAEAGAGPVFRTGRRFPDARAVQLAIDDGESARMSVRLDLGQGRRTGVLVLLHPRSGGAKLGPDTDRLRARLLPLAAEVEAVLCRLRLPLSQISGLAVGDVLPLPRASVRHMTLEAPRGCAIAEGHLGQSSGSRAVRLRGPAEAGSGSSAPDWPAGGAAQPDATQSEVDPPKGGVWPEIEATSSGPAALSQPAGLPPL